MYEDIKKKFSDLEKKLSDPALSADPARLAEVSKGHAELKPLFDLVKEQEKLEQAIESNKELAQSDPGSELSEMAEAEIEAQERTLEKIKQRIDEELSPADPNDKKNIIMEIRAGTGGDESALFAADLFRMYSRYAESKGWKIDILDSSQTGIGGFKEVIFEVNGKNVYKHLKYEAGTHRVQRVPETEKQGRVHTSAATVAVLPEAEEVDIEIKPEDIRIDTYAASGPGGQKVNTTNSAVRITYLPTNLVVQCQDQKSQHQNKEKALSVLRSRLLKQIEEERMSREAAERKSMVGSGDRSEKIRTYNFPQDRITDHRIKKSWSNMDIILSGDLDRIIHELQAAS